MVSVVSCLPVSVEVPNLLKKGSRESTYSGEWDWDVPVIMEEKRMTGACVDCSKQLRKEAHVRCVGCHYKDKRKTRTVRNPKQKCGQCSGKCSKYMLYCTKCKELQAKRKSDTVREQKRAQKTRLAPGTGTKHRKMTPEDYERVFGKRPSDVS